MFEQYELIRCVDFYRFKLETKSITKDLQLLLIKVLRHMFKIGLILLISS